MKVILHFYGSACRVYAGDDAVYFEIPAVNPPRPVRCGSWPSPITSSLIVEQTRGLGEPQLDGGMLYWLETRPAEGGRNVIMRTDAGGDIETLTPDGYNVRSSVHEYGGGAYVVGGGSVYFVNHTDQRIYRQRHGEPPHPVTAPMQCRYADLTIDTSHNRLICVCEDHRGDGEPLNSLISIPLDAGEHVGRVQVARGHDFYAGPRLSPDGRQLAFLTWDHPHMPWDATTLWQAEIRADGTLNAAVAIAGGSDESVFQPGWSPDGVLHFVSDRSGWWNLYRSRGGTIEALCERTAEFGLPQWVFGQSTYGFLNAREIICCHATGGLWQLGILDTAARRLHAIDCRYTEISGIAAGNGRAVFEAGAPDAVAAIVTYHADDNTLTEIRNAGSLQVDGDYFSIPRPLEYPSGNGETAHALYYPPQNRDCQVPGNERPPLLVRCHGGPTACASGGLNLGIQYWTSRGFAVLDVNYRGSSGFGRAYRQALNGRWGVADVEDCVNGARHLVATGHVDGEQLAMRGSSAGGYTTLCALTFHDVFRAGASLYGISDLEALIRDTHKFESRYLERMIGPYPAARDLYRARSPLHHAAALAAPVIFLQGSDDKVVPPDQAERMVTALRERGVPVAYLLFEGEGHGFRRAETIKRALDAELYFYGRIFGFTPADPLEPIVIDNL
jgi:acetyl esterase/lipase